MIFTHATFAQEVFRVTSVNFDTSNSLIFLTSPDNTTESIMKNVKLIKLQKPKRVYFDIDSAILTAPSENLYFNAGGLKQAKIGQFSTNPNKIRIVLYMDEDFDLSKIIFLKVNNNIVIKFKDGMCKDDYFQNTYRDEKTSSSDFYENLSISNEEIEKAKVAVSAPEKDEMLSEIQQAFNAVPAKETAVKPVSAVSPKAPEVIKKELKLKSRFFLNSVTTKQNGFLIGGFGVVGVEKPMYLTNPARVIFDIPNAVVSANIRNQEFKLNQDSIKIGQFSSNKVRVVITSNNLEKYFPIFSSDGQSVFFSLPEGLDYTTLFTKTTDAVSYYVKRLSTQKNLNTDEFIIAFNAPVIHSIKRDNFKLTMNFYNALRYNDKNFRNTIAQTDLSDMEMDLLPQVGLKLVLPLDKDSLVDCYLGADAKSIRIVVKNIKPKFIATIQEKTINVALHRFDGKKAVVLDAGHGGADYGAIRAGINEKDINLDIAKRVEAILSSKGVSVSMTRYKDETVSLEGRTTFCSSQSPDIFVSIHVNSSVRPEITGIETHYYHQESLCLAQTVHSSLASYIKSNDRGLFKSKFYVINHTSVPAILVEIGFISNDRERSELVSEQRKQQTAKSIAEGILKYLNK